MEDKGAALEAQRKQALKKGRDVTAQKLALEVSFMKKYTTIDPFCNITQHLTYPLVTHISSYKPHNRLVSMQQK